MTLKCQLNNLNELNKIQINVLSIYTFVLCNLCGEKGSWVYDKCVYERMALIISQHGDLMCFQTNYLQDG